MYLYLDPKYLKNTKYIQVQTSNVVFNQKLYTVAYIDSSVLCVDIIG